MVEANFPRGTTNKKHYQIWVVTRHQYGISVLVSQTSLREETSGGIVICRLFSHANKFLDFVASLSNRTIFLR